MRSLFRSARPLQSLVSRHIRCGAQAQTPLAELDHHLAAWEPSPNSREYRNGLPRVDPFSLVAEELAGITERMRNMVVSEVPKLASAAEYYFLSGSSGKRFRPTVLLLMASSLGYNDTSPVRPLPHFPPPFPSLTPKTPFPVAAAAAAASAAASVATTALGTIGGVQGNLGNLGAVPLPLNPQMMTKEQLHQWQRQRQRTIAEITEMIHVASLLHDDVLDHADTRRGVRSLNFVMGNKLAVLAGDFLLARASCALASLRNSEVVELLSRVLEHLVSGEIMQMAAERKDHTSMDYYLRKTFFKTASLMAHSCKAVAVLGGHNPEICTHAYDYGRHLGLAFQLVDDALDYTGTSMGLGKPALNDIKQGLVTAPVLFAMEEHPEMSSLVDRRFRTQGDMDLAVDFVRRSHGVQKTLELAREHSLKAQAAVEQFPPASNSKEETSRQGLMELTEIVLTRKK